jgi:hypothetical protein
MWTDVSKEPITSLCLSVSTCCILVSCSAYFQSWRWRWCIAAKRRFTYRLHFAVSHKVETFDILPIKCPLTPVCELGMTKELYWPFVRNSGNTFSFSSSSVSSVWCRNCISGVLSRFLPQSVQFRNHFIIWHTYITQTTE